jgi:hypothetical protein
LLRGGTEVILPDEEKNKKLAEEIHREWQVFVEATQYISRFESNKSESIEVACRALWDLWDDEDKRQAMGWTSWGDLFHEGNEELHVFFHLIEDRILLNSESNRQRFYSLLALDSDPTIAECHMLRERHWTRITQFNSRVSRLQKAARMPEGEEKTALVKDILEPAKEEKANPEPDDQDWKFDGKVGTWRGKPALRLAPHQDYKTTKLIARLFRSKVAFFVKRDDAEVLASDDGGVCKMGTILLPQSDQDYPDFVAWLSRLGIK